MMPRNKIKPIIMGVVIFSLISVIIITLLKPSSVSTNNAYLKSDIITIKPKVSGYISEVLVSDNQQVKTGQVIARIDDQEFQYKLQKASAQVKAAENRMDILNNKLSIQDLKISKSSLELNSTKITSERSEKNYLRSKNLIKNKTISQQSLEKSQETQLNDKNAYEASLVALKSSMTEKQLILAEYDEAKSLLKAFQNELELAKFDLENTSIKAAFNGVVTTRSLQVGQLAHPSTSLGYLVRDNIWAIANFKEVQITKMKAKQIAIIKVDSFPDVTFTGKVESLSPATGSEFSILPPENATGNFTKIVQRIPIKIVFDSNQDLSLLRSGLSCKVEVELK